MPLHRRVNNCLVSYVGSKLCGANRCPIFQSGYRLIRDEVLRQVHLETERYETESELLIKAGRLGVSELKVCRFRHGTAMRSSHIKTASRDVALYKVIASQFCEEESFPACGDTEG